MGTKQLAEEHVSQSNTTAATSVQSVVTSRDFGGRWCPDVCPITLEPFFMWIEHPRFGWVPTYGGPFDSYTIPEPDLPENGAKPRMDIEYHRYRYDHAKEVGEGDRVATLRDGLQVIKPEDIEETRPDA